MYILAKVNREAFHPLESCESGTVLLPIQIPRKAGIYLVLELMRKCPHNPRPTVDCC